MSGYRVDLDQLDGFVARVAAFEKRAEQIAESVDGQVDQLHDGHWLGAAAAAHRAKHDEWMAAEAEMREALVRLRDAARTAHQNYSDAVNTNTAMWP
jgi:WXG100 family type VII secretion target